MSLRTVIWAELAALGEGVAPFDVHAHTGADVDGTTRSSDEHLRDLDAVGGRSVIFPFCVTTGYEAENRRVLGECRQAPERLTPSPGSIPGSTAWARLPRRPLAAGARGFSARRTSGSTIPGVDAILSVAAERRF